MSQAAALPQIKRGVQGGSLTEGQTWECRNSGLHNLPTQIRNKPMNGSQNLMQTMSCGVYTCIRAFLCP